MKKFNAMMINVGYKLVNRKKLNDEEKLFVIRNNKIVTIISGILWSIWCSFSLGMSAHGYIKGMTESITIISSFASIVIELGIHFIVYNKLNNKAKGIKRKRQLEEFSQKIEELTKSAQKELKPSLNKFLEQLNNKKILEKYYEDVKTASGIASSNKPTLITDFSKLELLLNETILTDGEKLEVITYYYSKNFVFFDQYAEKDIFIETEDKTVKLEMAIEFADETLYNQLKNGFAKANEFIDLNGNILPKKNELTEEDMRIINIENQLNINPKYVMAILKNANQKWYRYNKQQSKKAKIEEELKIKLAKIRIDELEVTSILIDYLIELMNQAKWDIKLIEETKKELMHKLQRRNYLREQDNIEKDILRQKELQAANKIINNFIDINFNYEPLKFLNKDEIKQLNNAMKTLGYKADKIMLIIKKVEIFNQNYLQEIENEKCYQFLNQLFEAIELNDANFPASKSINIYNKAKTLISDSRVLDISLNYLKEQILFYVNFIDETIKANLENSITPEIVNDIKETVAELDRIFSQIYEINNASKRQLIRFDESTN